VERNKFLAKLFAAKVLLVLFFKEKYGENFQRKVQREFSKKSTERIFKEKYVLNFQRKVRYKLFLIKKPFLGNLKKVFLCPIFLILPPTKCLPQ
jgi:hypothetical protein